MQWEMQFYIYSIGNLSLESYGAFSNGLRQLTKALLVVLLNEYKILPEMDSTSVYFWLFFFLFPFAYSFLSLFRICSWHRTLFESLFFI